MADLPDVRFTCPVSGIDVAWAAKDAFNPGAVVHEGRVHMLFRGEDTVGRFAGTSRIGLAVSDDGLVFAVHPRARAVPGRRTAGRPGSGRAVARTPGWSSLPTVASSATYTAFDGKVGTLFVATSDDLRHWTKHGPAFASTPACAALVEERFDRDRGERRPPGGGTHERPILDVLGRGNVLRRHVRGPRPMDARRLRRHPGPLPLLRPVGRPALGRERRTGPACAPADSVSPAATVRFTLGRTRATGPFHRRTGSS